MNSVTRFEVKALTLDGFTVTRESPDAPDPALDWTRGTASPVGCVLPAIEDDPGSTWLPDDGRISWHAAAPVVLYAQGNTVAFWAVVVDESGAACARVGEDDADDDGDDADDICHVGVLHFTVPNVAALLAAGQAGGELANTTHPESGKPIVVSWLPHLQQIEFSTFYADVPPHDFDKPYIIRIDADNAVTVVAWWGRCGTCASRSRPETAEYSVAPLAEFAIFVSARQILRRTGCCVHVSDGSETRSIPA